MSDSLQNIPEFVEDRFLVKHTSKWWIMYRENDRELALCGWSDEQVARSRCKILNDLFYDAIINYRDNKMA